MYKTPQEWGKRLIVIHLSRCDKKITQKRMNDPTDGGGNRDFYVT